MRDPLLQRTPSEWNVAATNWMHSNYLQAFGSTHDSRLLSPAFRESVGTLNLIRPSVPLSVCPSVCLSVCLSVCHKNFNLAHIFWSINDKALIFGMILVTSPFHWYHAVTLTLTFDLLQGQICCRAGDHNSSNLLVCIDFWVKSAQRWIQGRVIIGQWGALLQRTTSSELEGHSNKQNV